VPREPAWSHASHCPLQSVLQQRPSTQWPFVHCEKPPQVAPSGSFLTQMPAEQNSSAAHAEPSAQGPAHWTPALSHPTTSQLCCWSGAHEPLPWQKAARSARSLLHEPGRH